MDEERRPSNSDARTREQPEDRATESAEARPREQGDDRPAESSGGDDELLQELVAYLRENRT